VLGLNDRSQEKWSQGSNRVNIRGDSTRHTPARPRFPLMLCLDEESSLVHRPVLFLGFSMTIDVILLV